MPFKVKEYKFYIYNGKRYEIPHYRSPVKLDEAMWRGKVADNHPRLKEWGGIGEYVATKLDQQHD